MPFQQPLCGALLAGDGLVSTLPFTVWVLTSFFGGLPEEVEQAVIVDGATAFHTFRLIILLLTAPALVTPVFSPS